MKRIGVDLGGTKIEVIAIDDSGATLVRQRVPTPVGDYLGTLEAIKALVASVEEQLDAKTTVGVATPGAMSKASLLLKNSNSTVLNGRPLDRDLASILERPIRLANDANCFALSEAIDGAAADEDVVFGVILGTGVGGGIVIGRQVVVGRNNIAGEWGHNPLPWQGATDTPGSRCYCGKSSCIETFLSGDAFSRDYFQRTGHRLTAKEIGLAILRGERDAEECLALYKDRLARSLAMVIDVLDPDKIVLGGGLSNISQLYEGLAALASRYAFSDRIDTPIVQATHGDSSGVRGAAWLWTMDRWARGAAP